MKYAKRWTYEHVWLLFNGLALLVIPFGTLSLNSQKVWATYHAVPLVTLVLTVALGFGWGIGSVLCGIAYTMLGLGLGMSVVLGLAAIVGSILPLLVLAPERLWNAQTTALYWSIIVLIIGLVFVARAGHLREVSRGEGTTTNTADLNAFGKGELRKGLFIAISSGILSGLLNVGLIYGSSIRTTALQLGASTALAVSALSFPVTAAGFFGILIYSSYLLTRRNSWKLYFAAGSQSHWLLVLLMALLYTASIWLYTYGANRAGSMGAVLGFPAYMSSMIIAGNVAGALTGEWKDAAGASRIFALGGLLALIGAIVLISRANL
jgi:L-rhamnose-H+ transport protein